MIVQQLAEDREEMIDLISNGIYRLEKKIVQLQEEVILQRTKAPRSTWEEKNYQDFKTEFPNIMLCIWQVFSF